MRFGKNSDNFLEENNLASHKVLSRLEKDGRLITKAKTGRVERAYGSDISRVEHRDLADLDKSQVDPPRTPCTPFTLHPLPLTGVAEHEGKHLGE